MQLAPSQSPLFEQSSELPHGLIYQPDFLSPTEEAGLLAEIRQLPFREARFQQYTARRRVVRYGEADLPETYGLADEEDNPQRPFPGYIKEVRRRVAHWRGVAEEDFVHALVTEYQPGTPIGWHSDAPHFEIVVGISLAGTVRMRFRPYAALHDRGVGIELEPRSAYVMQDEIRWKWQHHIPPAKHLRYSITLRTLRKGPAPAKRPVRAGAKDPELSVSGGA
jgi:alkylated DNA repair dioxygenase AlkB